MDIVKRVVNEIAHGVDYIADEVEEKANYSRGYKDGNNDRPRNRYFEHLKSYEEGYVAGSRQAQADTQSPPRLPRSFNN